jgi:hypothetical protein
MYLDSDDNLRQIKELVHEDKHATLSATWPMSWESRYDHA